MIERTNYLNQLIDFKDQKLIKIVTGIRRCGKSTLFDIYINYLKENGIKEKQIIKINLENPEYNFNDYMELYNYVKKKLIKYAPKISRFPDWGRWLFIVKERSLWYNFQECIIVSNTRRTYD